MDIGFLAKGKGKKGNGKGKKGKGKGPHQSFFGTLKGKSKGKGKAQGKGKGKNFGSLSASASAKGGGSSSSALSSAVCWTCGRRGHFANKCPLNRVSAFEETEEEQLYVDEEEVWDSSWEDWTVGALSDDWSWFGDSWDS